MRKATLTLTLALVLAVVTVAPAVADNMAASDKMGATDKMAASGKMGSSDKADVVSAVKKWTADFNKSDTKAFLAACAPNAVIIDEFPPYVWQGASACSDWMAANDAQNKATQATGGVVTLGKPMHIEVMGDRAYAVFGVKFADTEKGKPVTQMATWTLTLQKAASGWVFTSSAWAEH